MSDFVLTPRPVGTRSNLGVRRDRSRPHVCGSKSRRRDAGASLIVLALLALPLSACAILETPMPDRAIGVARRHVRGLLNNPPDGICGLSDETLFGGSIALPFGVMEVLPFGAGETRVVELTANRSFRVVVPYWCSGSDASGVRKRLTRELSLDLDYSPANEFVVRAVRVSRSDALELRRQFQPWLALLLLAPLVVYGVVVWMVVYSAAFGAVQPLASLASLQLSDIPGWVLISLRIATIGLVAWAGLTYFGGWLAAFVSIFGCWLFT